MIIISWRDREDVLSTRKPKTNILRWEQGNSRSKKKMFKFNFFKNKYN